MAGMNNEQNRQLAADIARERPRLRNFIRRRVNSEADAEDILQDVFAELIEVSHLMQPVEYVGAWLYRVARNRITDLFRKRQTEARVTLPDPDDDTGLQLGLDELLSGDDAGPESAYVRSILLDELDLALSELPPEQQEVFVAHEFEGLSFKTLSAETGLSVNTLLARKHYAVRYLRQRLQAIYEEIKDT
jgi:RNA polymerase sigma factor (sigma-70 family)